MKLFYSVVWTWSTSRVPTSSAKTSPLLRSVYHGHHDDVSPHDDFDDEVNPHYWDDWDDHVVEQGLLPMYGKLQKDSRQLMPNGFKHGC